MADPFGEDFLDTIVNVGWRTGPPPIPTFPWFAIEQVGAVNAFINTVFTVSIADVGDFQPFSGTQNGAGWAGYLHVPVQPISGGMVSGSLSPSGGVTSINGFGQADNAPFNIPHTFLFFKLDDKFPKKPFKVTVTNSIEGDIGSAKLRIVATSMKKIVEGDTIYPDVTSQIVVNKAGMNHSPSVFTVDPKTLKITGG